MNTRQIKFAVIVYLILILAASSIPGHSFPKSVIFTKDKLLHTMEYAVLAFLLIRAFNPRTLAGLLGVIGFCFAFGLIDEFWQSFVPGRFSSIYDTMADTLGAFLVTIGTVAYRRIKRV